MDLHQAFRQTYRFCPVCKTKLDGRENAVSCPQCGFTAYNNPAVSVSMTIVKDGQFLLARRAVEPHKGTWDVLGGFVDAGESAEEAAVREMKEETGLDTAVEAYLGSTWDIYGDRPSLPLMFLMKTLTDQQPQPHDDISELQWFSFENLPDNVAFRNVGITIKKAQQYITGRK